MTLGMGSYSYHHCFGLAGQPGMPTRFDVFDVMDCAAGLGLAAVYIDAYHVGSLDRDNLRRVRDGAQERGIALQLGFMGTDIETLGPWLHAAAALGSPVLRTFVSRSRYEPPVCQQVRTAIANLRETVKLAEDVGVKVAIENHMELRSEELLQIAAGVPSDSIGFCLDTGNPLPVLEDPLEAARNLAPLVLMVHLKDATITLGGDTAVFHGVPLGEGIVPLREIVEVVRAGVPEAGVFLESLVVAGETPQATWEIEQAAARDGIRYAREALGL